MVATATRSDSKSYSIICLIRKQTKKVLQGISWLTVSRKVFQLAASIVTTYTTKTWVDCSRVFAYEATVPTEPETLIRAKEMIFLSFLQWLRSNEFRDDLVMPFQRSKSPFRRSRNWLSGSTIYVEIARMGSIPGFLGNDLIQAT